MASALITIRTWLAARVPEHDDEGASLVEYALLVALIATVCIVAITVLGTSVSQSYSSTAKGFG